VPFQTKYRWQPPQSPLKPEAPLVVLAAPGSLSPRHRLTQALAAGSLLAVAFRPAPSAPAVGPFVVTNTHAAGAGSLAQAVHDANTHPGPDSVTFDAGVTGTIVLTGQVTISGSVAIIGPGPGALAVSGNNLSRVFYLTATSPLTATISGLTIRDGRPPASLSDNDGGGILAEGAQLTLDNDHILNNTATTTATRSTDGGGVDVEDVPLLAFASLTVRNSLISGNYSDHGGGVYAYYASNGVTIQNSQILSNTSYYSGGGVFIQKPKSSVLIEDTTVADNTAGNRGGGIMFYEWIAGSGSQVIQRTTLSGNTAKKGGGLYLGGAYRPVVVENSTIAGNHATTLGGGVFLDENGSEVSFQHNTIAGNTATLGAGGLLAKNETAAITDTIIAGNLAPVNSDISGTLSLSYDLVQIPGTASITNSGGNVFGLDPLLGPLANNGGATQTMLPAHSGPAVNAGDPAFAGPPATDQRGLARVIDGRIDIGAVEALDELFLPLVRK